MKFVGLGGSNRQLHFMKIIDEAQKEGIVDIDSYPNKLDQKTIELAIKLMKKHGPKVYKDLEKRRKSQEK